MFPFAAIEIFSFLRGCCIENLMLVSQNFRKEIRFLADRGYFGDAYLGLPKYKNCGAFFDACDKNLRNSDLCTSCGYTCEFHHIIGQHVTHTKIANYDDSLNILREDNAIDVSDPADPYWEIMQNFAESSLLQRLGTLLETSKNLKTLQIEINREIESAKFYCPGILVYFLLLLGFHELVLGLPGWQKYCRKMPQKKFPGAPFGKRYRVGKFIRNPSDFMLCAQILVLYYSPSTNHKLLMRVMESLDE